MKILQVSTMDLNGGAEKIAWDLHRTFRARGHEAFLVVGMKRSDDPYTVEIGGTWSKHRPLQALASGEMLGLQGFHHPASHRILELVGEPWDVAHLHNLHARYFDLAALPELAAVAPTIVTMHDMWLLTGHCAHSFSCQRWRIGCGRCPDLSIYPAARFDFTRRNLARKRRYFPHDDIVVSSPSRWLLDLVGESYLAALPRRYMPNTVDTTVFAPGEQRVARQALGLPEGVPIALFPAQLTSPPSSFKGQDTFLAAIRGLAPEGVQGLAFGDPVAAADLQGVLRVLPATFDDRRLADGYRAADIVVLPSRAETLGLGVLEAMACGRPVVATRVGGIPELVSEGATGDLVAAGDTEGLITACRRLLASPGLRARYGAAGREAAKSFELAAVADAWLELYASLVEARVRRSPR